MSFFVYLFIIFFFSTSSSSFSSELPLSPLQIAICISGQLGRLQPIYLATQLIGANPFFSYSLFFNLQSKDATNTTIFNTEADGVFVNSVTEYELMLTQEDVSASLRNTFKSYPAVKRVYTAFHERKRLGDYTSMFKRKNLNRIYQYLEAQPSILNMYSYQEACVRQLQQTEAEKSFKFDYVISTRDDVYFFEPMNLTRLILDFSQPSGRNCSIVSKSCLAWGGLNMRLQLLQRDSAVAFLGRRMDFYASLYHRAKNHRQTTAANPEIFGLIFI